MPDSHSQAHALPHRDARVSGSMGSSASIAQPWWQGQREKVSRWEQRVRPARMTQIGQHLGQNLQERRLFFVHGDDAVQQAAIPAQGLDDVQAVECFDDPSSCHLPSVLARLALHMNLPTGDFLIRVLARF